MKTKINVTKVGFDLLLMLPMLFVLVASGQQYCGFDASRVWHKAQDSRVLESEVQFESGLLQFLETHPMLRGGGETYVIPVVVHIIHQNGAENIPDEQVEQAIEWLNDAYANSGFYTSGDGVNMQVQFCLAHVNPAGEFSSGINRVESTLTSVVIPDEDLELKDLSRWDPFSYMNIWVVSELIRAEDNTSIIGNSSMPALHGTDYDGVIIEAAFFGSSENLTKAFVHEVGHYLGLYHTFEGGCANDNCMLDGDHVCDTPPDGMGSAQSCLDGNNSCDTDDDDESDNNPYRPVGLGGLGDQSDMQQNYMDYSSLTCYDFFTGGQADRVLATLLETRYSLLEGDRCNPPCTESIVPDITASADSILLGENVVFDNNTANVDEVTWYVNEELVATTNDFTFVPDEPGMYFVEVLLANEQPGCNLELEYYIEVVCPTMASFTTTGETFLQNVPIIFTNTSVNGISYVWTVDGEIFSTSTNIEISFSEFGTHQVCLKAIGALCEVNYCQLISIGNCATGNENRHWITYTGEESVNQIYFSEQGTTFTTEIIAYSENKSTISDENGQMLFSTNGEQLYDMNLQVTPNGDGLLGGFSSRKGSIFVKAPASDVQYYLFYTDMQEDDFVDGLHYSLVDRTLNNGLGDIVSGMKNIYISTPYTEAITAIRHCNYEDFWVLYYNVAEERYETYLVSSEGVAAEPVIFDFPASNFTSATEYYYDIRVSPRGDYFIHNKNLLHFDASNGNISLYHQFDFFEVSFYDFSPSGHYLILQSQSSGLQVFLHQIDMTLPPEAMESEMFSMTQSLFAIYSDMQRTPSGEIYLAGVFAGEFDIIHFPELPGMEMDLEYGAVENAGFTNSFGNYFHAYSQAPVFIDGITKVCEDHVNTYEIYGCAEGAVSWHVNPPIPFVQLPGGSLEVVFPDPGIYELSVELETTCGIIQGSVQIQVSDGTAPDLGPDTNICSGESLTLDPAGSFESYVWSTEAETASIQVSSPGLYSVTTTDEGGCEYTDEIEILETIVGSIDLGPDFEYCDSTVVILDAGDDFLDYTWQDGTTGATYTIFEAGTYTVTSTLPCDATDSILIEACHDVVQEQGGDSPVMLFPNPVNTTLTVQLPAEWKDLTIAVHDVSGRLVYEKEQVNQPTLTVDVSMWASGIYEIRFNTAGTSYHTRFMVWHL